MENGMSEPKIWSQKYVKSTRVVVVFAWNSIFDQAKLWKALGYVHRVWSNFFALTTVQPTQKKRAPAHTKLFSFEMRNQSKLGF